MLLAEVALVVDGSVADEAIGDVDIVSVSSFSSPSRFLFDEILLSFPTVPTCPHCQF